MKVHQLTFICRRVLISQNYDQIYVTIGEYGLKYIEYVTGKPFLPPNVAKTSAKDLKKTSQQVAADAEEPVGNSHTMRRLRSA